MLSYSDIRKTFHNVLENRPNGIDLDEFNRIVEEALKLYVERERSNFKRLEYWLSHSETDDAKPVCADIELVRFGVLEARPDQKKNSDPSRGLSFAQTDHVERFFKHAGIDLKQVNTIKRLKDTVEARAQLIDVRVEQSISTGETIRILEPEIMTVETNIGNNRPIAMKYISVEQLVQCIANSQNASAIREYAMRYNSIRMIYNQELLKVKDKFNGILRADNNSLLSRLERLEGNTEIIINQNKGLSLQVVETNTKLDEVKTELVSVNDQLSKSNLRNDIFIGMIVNLAFTPKIAKDLVELYTGQNGIIFEPNAPWNGIDTVKMFFIFAWTNADCTQMTIQVACRNFNQTKDRLKQIITIMKRQSGTFLGCKAIALVDKDVNEEKKLFDNVFESRISDKQTFKRFDADIANHDDARTKYNDYINRLHTAFRMRHQSNITRLIEDEGANANGSAAKSIERQYLSFNDDALLWCQEYIDSLIVIDSRTINTIDLRKATKDHTFEIVHDDEQQNVRMHRCSYAKVQLKLCIRDFNNRMEAFTETLREASDDEVEIIE